MQLATTASAVTLPRPSTLALSFASSPEEIREVQRLRYQVFIESMGLTALANPERLDQDQFDHHCDHLIVRDTRSTEVVGTYRVLGPQAAHRIGGYYSDQEFDLTRINTLRTSMAEAGRACIHQNYRSGAVIMLLWSGLADYMKRYGCKYLIGCASISLADGGRNALSIYHALRDTHLAPEDYMVRPRLPLPIDDRPLHQAVIPPLIKGYLRGGAWVCGEPAWDPAFNCADLFLLLPLDKLDNRYARHYFKGASEQ